MGASRPIEPEPSPRATGSRADGGSIDRLRAVVSDEASIREWTAVANDSIVATAGILEGFAGAGADQRALVLAAVIATIAGMFATGGSRWAEAAAERDAQLDAAADEAASLAVAPEEELRELVAYYQAKGLSSDLAHRVAEELTARDPLAAQLESEHGIRRVLSRTDLVMAGIGAALAYGVGAAIPLVITVVVPTAIETSLIFVAVIIALVFTSVIGARTGHTNFRHTLVRALTVGIVTMVVSYAVGTIVF